MSVILIVAELKPVTLRTSPTAYPVPGAEIVNAAIPEPPPPVASVTSIVRSLLPPPVVAFIPVVPLLPAATNSAASPGPVVVTKVLLPLNKNPLC